jgi:hypothetical protein
MECESTCQVIESRDHCVDQGNQIVHESLKITLEVVAIADEVVHLNLAIQANESDGPKGVDESIVDESHKTVDSSHNACGGGYDSAGGAGDGWRCCRDERHRGVNNSGWQNKCAREQTRY